MAKHDVYSHRYVVTDATSGKRRKSQSINQASDRAGLDSNDAAWAIEEHGRADSDTHSIVPQSRGKPSPKFAFRD